MHNQIPLCEINVDFLLVKGFIVLCDDGDVS